MDRFFAEISEDERKSGKFSLHGEDVKHISKVLRYSEGDKIEVCDGDNREYICEIKAISKESIDLEIEQEVDMNRESDIKVVLYQGLPKSAKMEIILQKLTECGVDEIVLVKTKRSVVNIDDKKSDKKLERWERIIYEASKQSKRGRIPELRGIVSFEKALEDMNRNDINISPYENEKNAGLKSVLRSDEVIDIISKNRNSETDTRVGIFIGPEGGFDKEENGFIRDRGVHSVSLGPRILRTETASIVATSIVMYELGDIGGDF